MTPPDETMTMVTDYLLAMAAVVCAVRLWPLARREASVAMMMWAVGFIALALAAVAGGTYHGFRFLLSDSADVVLWKFTLLSIGVFNLMVLWGSIVARSARLVRNVLLTVNVVLFAAYVVWITTHDDYRLALYGSVVAMIGVFALHLVHVIWDASARWMIAGVGVSAIAAFAQSSRFGIWLLNHNDLYHLVQIVGVYMFYRGAKLLRDRNVRVNALER